LRTEKSSKGDQRTLLAIVVVSYLSGIALGFLATWYGINYNSILWEKLGNLLITATVGGATIIMVYFVAHQAFLTRESIEEMRKQRLMPIVVPARGCLYHIKETIQKNFEILMNLERSNEDIDPVEKIEEIQEELQKVELMAVDGLLDRNIYRALKKYQDQIRILKENSAKLKATVQVLGDDIRKILEDIDIVKEKRKEIESEPWRSVNNLGVVSFFRYLTNNDVYRALLILIRESLWEESTEKIRAIDIYTQFKQESIKRLEPKIKSERKIPCESWRYCLEALRMSMKYLGEESKEIMGMIEKASDDLWNKYVK